MNLIQLKCPSCAHIVERKKTQRDIDDAVHSATKVGPCPKCATPFRHLDFYGVGWRRKK